MAFLIQERKACQPLTPFKPPCVKELEEWIGAKKKRAEKRKWTAMWAALEKGKGLGLRKMLSWLVFFFYDTHLSQEWSAALIW